MNATIMPGHDMHPSPVRQTAAACNTCRAAIFRMQQRKEVFSSLLTVGGILCKEETEAYEIFLTIAMICGFHLSMMNLSTSDYVDNTIEITSNTTVKEEINGN
ncbi:hypothetical protein AVEN_24273-1 [Araneus ventricosus]|uniref:Uncharacterized protein n=1 Tax=Araneus ventricosus TaxID=182803 RepID=A0A4Y2RDM4_ARAVE|nr:hypothetical protein AVEN_24273-1 [Araneus ventricosus]